MKDCPADLIVILIVTVAFAHFLDNLLVLGTIIQQTSDLKGFIYH